MMRERLDEALSSDPEDVQLEGTLVDGPVAESLAQVATEDGGVLVVGSRAYGPLRPRAVGLGLDRAGPHCTLPSDRAPPAREGADAHVRARTGREHGVGERLARSPRGRKARGLPYQLAVSSRRAAAHEHVARAPRHAKGRRFESHQPVRNVGRRYEEQLRQEAEATLSMFARRDSHAIGASAFKQGRKPEWPHHGL